MAKTTVNKPLLVTAGPGAGKTHTMVERIVEALPAVPPFRYLAAITFTNAATASIRDRVHRTTRPGSNVFIGTIHSFANRFIVSPFARPFQQLPDERMFGGINVHELIDAVETKKGRRLSPQDRNGIRKKLVTSLLKKGIVPYDEIINVACELMDHKRVRECVGRRLNCVFIDEFQDTDPRHFKLFEHIRKAGSTKIYAVGDPEQFVYSFTYGQRGRAHPDFQKIQFFQFRAIAEQQLETVNRRSCEEIVRFTNHFHAELQQTSLIGPRGEPRVLYFPETDMTAIVRRFLDRSDQIRQQRGQYHRLYLAFENAAFDDVRDQFGIRHLSNASRQHKTLLQDALELLALCRGESRRKVCESLSLSDLEWRKLGLQLIRELRNRQIAKVEDFLERWLPRLQISDLKERTTALPDALNHLRATVSAGRPSDARDWSSSIHKAKGLEATSVLVVASSLADLRKWCITDRTQRNADKQDKCRLGFVAFTRAMELLCIACRKPLDSPTRLHLEGLGVTLLPALQTP